MNDNYLDDLEKIKSRISRHWKNSFRKKKVKESDSESDGSSSSEDSGKRRKSKNKKNTYALTIDEEKKDKVNPYGVLICGHCGKLGHGIANCWILNGKPSNTNNTNHDNNRFKNGKNGEEQRQRKCWICGSKDHLARNCPQAKSNENKDEEDAVDANINNLFIGTFTQDNHKRKEKEMPA